ncbi:MAG TPA: hypothetical protein VG297_17170 [Bryobacteraceae bacterium]|jgi:hypothetical protein|nr:hypothetical protein [Bryobacteraceae bacterium]
MQFMMAWIAGILEILVPGRSRFSRATDETAASSPDYRKPAVF